MKLVKFFKKVSNLCLLISGSSLTTPKKGSTIVGSDNKKELLKFLFHSQLGKFSCFWHMLLKYSPFLSLCVFVVDEKKYVLLFFSILFNMASHYLVRYVGNTKMDERNFYEKIN